MKTLSQIIRECRDGVVNNPYQGPDKRVVFVCSMGILRSATGARLYAHKYNTRTAGTWPDALVPLTDELMAWAHEIVFVNRHNYEQVKTYFANQDLDIDKEFNIKVLDIPDSYEHMHPELIRAFDEQYEPLTVEVKQLFLKEPNNGPQSDNFRNITSVWDYANRCAMEAQQDPKCTICGFIDD
jgi:predicted protein tyrosine phosphatase